MIHVFSNPFALLILKLWGFIKRRHPTTTPHPRACAAISFLRHCPPCSPRAAHFYKLSQVSQPMLPSSYRLRYRLSLLLLVILSAGWVSITMPGGHGCFSFGELGLLVKLKVVIVTSSWENTTTVFYYAVLISGDFRFPTFQGSAVVVSEKQCSYESYNALAVWNPWFVWAVKDCVSRTGMGEVGSFHTCTLGALGFTVSMRKAEWQGINRKKGVWMGEGEVFLECGLSRLEFIEGLPLSLAYPNPIPSPPTCQSGPMF